MILLDAGKQINDSSKELQLIESIQSNLIRGDLSGQNIDRLFLPQLRLQAMKGLRENIVELSYKLTKLVNSA